MFLILAAMLAIGISAYRLRMRWHACVDSSGDLYPPIEWGEEIDSRARSTYKRLFRVC